MIQTIIFLSITTIVFLILFIITYSKLRTTERELVKVLIALSQQSLTKKKED